MEKQKQLGRNNVSVPGTCLEVKFSAKPKLNASCDYKMLHNNSCPENIHKAAANDNLYFTIVVKYGGSTGRHKRT